MTGVGVEEQEIHFCQRIIHNMKKTTFEKLTNVATKISKVPTASNFAASETLSSPATLAGSQTGGPTLDPNIPHFDVYKCAKMILRAADNANVKFRRAPFSFKNLDVSGSGSAMIFSPIWLRSS